MANNFFQTFKLLFHLASMDIRKRYLGTLLGTLWAFISPLVTILIIYFVFTFGLKTTTVGDVPFISWLVPGMLAWFYIADALSNGVAAIVNSPHLVTKVVFPVKLLPIAHVLAPMFVHLFLMLVLLLYLFFAGRGSTIFWPQLLYYLGCSCVLCVAISYFTSACMVFTRDIASVVGVGLQMFFWATPIFWNPAMLEGTKLEFLSLSPINYVVSGYRDSLLSGVGFWEKPLETSVFWAFTLPCLFLGIVLFKRMRPHFADVL